MALSMRRIIMLAVVSLIMALTVALSGTALAAPPGHPLETTARCARCPPWAFTVLGGHPRRVVRARGPCGT